MADIIIKYALANAEMTNINEITPEQFKTLTSNLDIVHMAKNESLESDAKIASYTAAESEIRNNVAAGVKKWNDVAKQISELTKKYPDIVSKHQELLADHTHNRWIRRDMFRVQPINAKVADKYDALNRQLHELDAYAPDCVGLLEIAMMDELNTRRMAEKSGVQDAVDETIGVARDNMKFAATYTYVISDLKVRVNGRVAKIRGNRRNLVTGMPVVPFHITLINEKIKINHR